MPASHESKVNSHAQINPHPANTSITPSSSASTLIPSPSSTSLTALSPSAHYQDRMSHSQHTRPHKIVFLPGLPGTLAARHQQIALLMQRNPWASNFDLRCVFAGDVHAHANEAAAEAHRQPHFQKQAAEASPRTARISASEVRRAATLRAAVEECISTSTLDDGASGHGIGQGLDGTETGVVVLIDGFPHTKTEAQYFHDLIGPPDGVIVFTGETAFLKRALTRELRARGRAREQARSFGAVGAGSGRVGAGSSGIAVDAGASESGEMRDLLRFVDGRRGGGVVVMGGGGLGSEVVEGDGSGEDQGGEVDRVENEVAERLGDGWHLPLLEVSCWYTAELGPRVVAEVDVRKGNEAVYAQVMKVLGQVIGKIVD